MQLFIMNELGTYIKSQRQKKKMNRCQLAQKSNLSSTAISRIENGERPEPSVKTIYKLSKALDVDIRELIEIIIRN